MIYIDQINSSLKEIGETTPRFLSRAGEVEKNNARYEADIARVNSQIVTYEENLKKIAEKQFVFEQKKLEQESEFTGLSFQNKTMEMELRRLKIVQERADNRNNFLRESIARRQRENLREKERDDTSIASED